MRIDDSVDHLLESFSGYFNQKGIVAHDSQEEPRESAPFLKVPASREYTLVIDLDETLVHYQIFTHNVYIRPHVQVFLEELSVHYELIIFTAAQQDYA
ncbi:MAG: HAD family hydrolase, partial [Ferruginibacter sp.]|nr:HAD family hydrolase [Ferruginibacter sp.]